MATSTDALIERWSEAGPTDKPDYDRQWYEPEPGEPITSALFKTHDSVMVKHSNPVPAPIKLKGNMGLVCKDEGILTPEEKMSQLVYARDCDEAIVDVNVATNTLLGRVIYTDGVHDSHIKLRGTKAMSQAGIIGKKVSHCVVDGDYGQANAYGGGGRGYGFTTSAGCDDNIFTGRWSTLRHHLPIQDNATGNVICDLWAHNHRHTDFQEPAPGSLEFHDACGGNLVAWGDIECIMIPGNSGPIVDTVIAGTKVKWPIRIGDADRLKFYGVDFTGTYEELQKMEMAPLPDDNPALMQPRKYWGKQHDPYVDEPRTGHVAEYGFMFRKGHGDDIVISSEIPEVYHQFHPEVFLHSYRNRWGTTTEAVTVKPKEVAAAPLQMDLDPDIKGILAEMHTSAVKLTKLIEPLI